MAPNHPNRSRKRIAASIPPVPMADVEPDPGVKARIKRMRQATFNAGAPPPPFKDTRPEHDADYARLLLAVRARFDAASNGERLFRTDAKGLYTAFLANLKSERRAHTCMACQRFVDLYGGLVAIDAAGNARPAMWDYRMVPGFYQDSVAAMQVMVENAKVVAPFLHPTVILGEPVTGNWTHFAVEQRGGWIWRHAVMSAEQGMAAMKERFITVRLALESVATFQLEKARAILAADEINRSEKFTGPLEWLTGRHGEYYQYPNRAPRMRDNRLWRAIAEAPEGFCHPRASVLWPLFEDIKAREPFDVIRGKFNAMVHGLAYQRSKADPAAQTIERAEKLFADLGLARALERRFARLDEVETIWTHRRSAMPRPAAGSGVFGRVKPAEGMLRPPPSRPEVPLQTLTWRKFTETVLPVAEAVDFDAPAFGNYQAMTTAVYPDAPQLLKWPNPFGHYVYNGGSSAASWSLTPGWRRVLAISLRGNLWGPTPAPHHGIGATLILEGAADTQRHHLCLFPETVRDELHEVRSVIEAFAKTGRLQEAHGALASGYGVTAHGLGPNALRVHAKGVWQNYHIDRWD